MDFFYELLAYRPMCKLFRQSIQAFVAILICLPVSVSATEIAVTLPPLAGLVSMLDAKADVMCLLPAGADPHHFQLTPRKIEALGDSRFLIRAAFDDSGWSLPTHHARTLALWPHTAHGWLNPASVRAALPRIAEALIALHPEHADAIDAALQHALAQVRHIEQSWRMALAPLQTSGVLMQHPAWLGLMKHMNVPVLAVLESAHHGQEFGPHQLEQALVALNQHPDAWLLADSGHNNRALDWLARHARQTPPRVTLNALGSCGLSWPELMQQNIARITALTQP